MAEVKYKPFVRYAVCGLVSIVPVFILCLAVYVLCTTGRRMPADVLAIALAGLVVVLVGFFSLFPNFRVTFSDAGIVKRNRVSLGPICLIDGERSFPWHSIDRVDYWSWGVMWGFIFTASHNNKTNLAAVLNWMFTNTDAALAIALAHVQDSRITARAHKAIRRRQEKKR